MLDKKFIAGIFKGVMLACLLWGGIRTKRQENWRAPSWSWASIDGPVSSSFVDNHIRCGKMEVLAEIEEVNLELVDSSNAYGQAKLGRLSMKSFVLPWKPTANCERALRTLAM